MGSRAPVTPAEPRHGTGTPPREPLRARLASTPPRELLRALLTAAHEVALDLLSIVWPCACVVCERPDRTLCRECRARLVAPSNRPLRVTTAGGLQVCTAGPYADALRAVLVGFKHQDLTRLVKPLGMRLCIPLSDALRRAPRGTPPLIVTAPSRPERVRERGYRPVDWMVREALREHRRRARRARRALQTEPPIRAPGTPAPGHPAPGTASGRAATGTPAFGTAAPGHPATGTASPIHIVGALSARWGRTGQVGLSADERRRNAALVRVPLRMRGRLRARNVILVDDIVTTGATLEGCVDALAAAGARVVGLVTLCATEKRLDPSRNLKARQ